MPLWMYGYESGILSFDILPTKPSAVSISYRCIARQHSAFFSFFFFFFATAYSVETTFFHVSLYHGDLFWSSLLHIGVEMSFLLLCFTLGGGIFRVIYTTVCRCMGQTDVMIVETDNRCLKDKLLGTELLQFSPLTDWVIDGCFFGGRDDSKFSGGPLAVIFFFHEQFWIQNWGKWWRLAMKSSVVPEQPLQFKG